jgi:hypothetical protein
MEIPTPPASHASSQASARESIERAKDGYPRRCVATAKTIFPVSWNNNCTKALKLATGGACMDQKSKQDEYLAKAKEAEDQAAKAADERSREGWLRIAYGYRDLARANGYRG